MVFSRGFKGKRRDGPPDRVPPGQYLTDDFLVPTERTRWLPNVSLAWTSTHANARYWDNRRPGEPEARNASDADSVPAVVAVPPKCDSHAFRHEQRELIACRGRRCAQPVASKSRRGRRTVWLAASSVYTLGLNVTPAKALKRNWVNEL